MKKVNKKIDKLIETLEFFDQSDLKVEKLEKILSDLNQIKTLINK